jgi:hypothetical protein
MPGLSNGVKECDLISDFPQNLSVAFPNSDGIPYQLVRPP